jgi:copper chaperone CopZ
MRPPDEPSSESFPQELVEAEFTVAGLDTPAEEKAIYTAFDQTKGVKSVDVSKGKITVEYDPIEVTKAELGETIGKAGFRITDVESGRESVISNELMTDAE